MDKEKALQVLKILKKTYPDAKCSLDFSTPFEMLVAVILSAQCTDDRVNKTTPSIFAKYSTPEDFNKIPLDVLESLIHPCGFYKNKAKNIKNTAKKIVEEYNNQVPDTMEALLTLPGVGRKTANVVMLEVFNKPQGIAVDTHAKRLSNRIGFSSKENPEKIEEDLLKLFSYEYLKDINHILIYHGRAICSARSPKCDKCPINKFCNYYMCTQNQSTKSLFVRADLNSWL